MYKAIIWDLDGTLLDTTEGVKYAVKYTIDQLGLKRLDEETIGLFVGPPMQLSFKKYFQMNDIEALRAANLFRTNYKEKSLLKARLYPNTLEVLNKLKLYGYKMAVATNKSHENAITILNHFGVAEFCDFMMGSDLEGRLKKADIIKICLDRLSVKPKEALYIGDSTFDMEGARTVGMDFVGVSYGFGFRKGDNIGYPVLDSMKEIEEFCNDFRYSL